MAVEWSFEQQQGAVTVRQEGDRAVCQAIHCADKAGLYKAWLRGEAGGRFLLGTLIPEGGALRLRRVIELSILKDQAVWPPAGAEIAMAYAFTQEPPLPQGWYWTERPGRLMGERLLAQAVGDVRRGLLKRCEGGFLLAFPYSAGSPFPIPPLFCLSRAEQIGDRRYLVFGFSDRGIPEPLHKISAEGEDRGEI